MSQKEHVQLQGPFIENCSELTYYLLSSIGLDLDTEYIVNTIRSVVKHGSVTSCLESQILAYFGLLFSSLRPCCVQQVLQMTSKVALNSTRSVDPICVTIVFEL